MDQPITHSPGRVPFSWERKPGIPKVSVAESFQRERKFVQKLQPPPYTSFQRNYDHALEIPLPPCTFQPHYKDRIRMQDHDPFLEAYKKCSKSRKTVERNKKLQIKTSIETRLRNSMSFISCKQSCVVRDDHLVRISYLLPNNVHEH
ncbi:hypothetical protein DEO72_LG11g3455 [Vigna unguiculata]|uniref:Uncharacterized protein n=1 Tax=Vigna unguiculata TaxID=3917 RepID=A0A4D6NV65_VIGUN|nr:hypothetical protein DEO72_LG11g3455 [Vigna unguiculata]